MASSLASSWTLLDSVIQLARYRRVLPLIPTGGIVADLGCGNGDLARILSHRARTVYGVDFHVGRVTAHRNVSFCEGNLNEHIPLKSESVDICVSLAVLEHLSAANVFVAEVQRVLKPGGRVIITTPTPRAKPILEFLACRLKVISEADIRDHKHYYQPEEIRSLFTSFTNVSISTFQCGMNTLATAVKPASETAR
jgi:2-polyprenyl-3-methyl-5-hydroxy-6-metoxy-1,4-benzoquinol methylase